MTIGWQKKFLIFPNFFHTLKWMIYENFCLMEKNRSTKKWPDFFNHSICISWSNHFSWRKKMPDPTLWHFTSRPYSAFCILIQNSLIGLMYHISLSAKTAHLSNCSDFIWNRGFYSCYTTTALRPAPETASSSVANK